MSTKQANAAACNDESGDSNFTVHEDRTGTMGVLLIEDHPGDARLIRELLADASGTAFDLKHVDRLSAALPHLGHRSFDVILLDLGLPDSQGLDTLLAVRGRAMEVPIVVLTGRDDDALALKAVRQGAQDYLVKQHLTGHLLALSLRYAVVRSQAQVALQESERQLRAGEEQYRQLFERSPHPMWVYDPQSLAFLAVNDAAVAHYGYGREEFLRMTVKDIRPPEEAASFIDYLARSEQNAPPAVVQPRLWKHRRKDGTPIDVEVTWSRLSFLGKNARLVFATDVTDRRRADQHAAELSRVQQEEAQVAAALAHVARELMHSLRSRVLLERLCQLTAEVLQCDTSHTLLWHAEEQVYVPVAGYGYSPEEWEALRVVRLPAAILAAPVAELAAVDVQQNRLEELSDSSLRGLARQLDLQVGLGMVLRHDEAVIGFHSACYRGRCQAFSPWQERVARGIAQQASVMLEHARVLDELERANRLKADFVATMSHELRTPISVIMGYTDLMLDGQFGAVPSEQADTLKRVRRRSEELLDMVDGVLNLSRLEAGRVPIDVRETSLAKLLGEVEGEVRPLVRPGVGFRWDVADAPANFCTDRTKLKVALRNLILNALKFTHQGSVTVTAQGSRNAVEIAVSDTGIGMTAETLAVIFEPFRQGDSSVAERYGGVGLGLYIVQRLVELLGGNLSVASEPGCGSKFRIWLPSEKE